MLKCAISRINSLGRVRRVYPYAISEFLNNPSTTTSPGPSSNSFFGVNFLKSANHRSISVSTRIMSSSATPPVNLSVNKPSALVDEALQIKIADLREYQNITVAAHLEEDGIKFVSHGHYTADEEGHVDLTTDWCVGGTYTGVEPMGLFWSMKLASGQRPGLRLMKKDVLTPFQVELSVLPGHVAVDDKENAQSNALADTTIERFYMSKDVQRIDVRDINSDMRVRGTLFLPPGEGPHPGVIDMFGTAGGLNEYRAALFASRGFACLALPYFRFDDLPKYVTLDMSYFQEAIDFLDNHPKVLKSGIGVVGVSKGAELAIHLATMSPKVRAAVPINTACYSHSGSLLFDDVEHPVSDPDMEHMATTEEGYFVFRDCYWLNDVVPESVLKIEKAGHAKFLLIGCDDDQQAHPANVHRIADRLKKHGLSNFKSIIYPGAGHLLEPPFTPLFRDAFHKLVGGVMVFGGETKPHADAQEHSWREIQRFLWQNLKPKSKSKL